MPRLRSVLLADAIACFASGGLLAVAPAAVAEVTVGGGRLRGRDPVGVLRGLGLAVAGVGAWVLATATASPIRRAAVLPVLAVEVAWVAGCALLLTRGRHLLTPIGSATVATAAGLVLAFFALEVHGLAKPGSTG
jgi:hypothetical protein